MQKNRDSRGKFVSESLTEKDLGKVFYDDGFAWKVSGNVQKQLFHWVRTPKMDTTSLK